MRARARFVCAYAISFCVDVERGPRMLERERALPSLITKPALLQTRLRLLQTSPSLRCVRRKPPMKNTARLALGPVGDSCHLLPCTASYVLLAETAPLGGAQAQGGGNTIKLLLSSRYYFLLEHNFSNL